MKISKVIREAGLAILLTLLPVIIIWAPFFLGLPNVLGVPIPNGGMATVVSNYDGPLYIAVAKTFYNQEEIKQNFSFNLPTEYYAAHFPLFPALIRVAALIIRSFPYGMLLVTILSSILALYFFNKFARLFVSEKSAFWLTLVFAIFPARWLIVRSVGSPEPLFVGSIIASMYFFEKKKYWWAGIWGVIAQLTKSPGILLFAGYAVAILAPHLKHVATTTSKNILKKFTWRAFPILFIPLSLLGVFLIFQIRMNNFLAYFNSGDNIHLFFPPFQIFNYSQPWVGTFWLEEIIFIYLFGALGVIQLYKKKLYNLLAFVAIFFVTTLFVSHRDLIRYSLPMVPFLLIGFSDVIKKAEFKFVIAFLAIPIYLFSLAYISQNFMQISDWAPLL